MCKCPINASYSIWLRFDQSHQLQLPQNFCNISNIEISLRFFPLPISLAFQSTFSPWIGISQQLSTFKDIQKCLSLTPCLAVNIVLTSKIWKSDERNPSWMNAHLFACLITCAKTLLKKQNFDQINVCCDRDVLHHKSMKIIFHSDGCYLNPNLVFCK